jgi:hypothetical protein
MENGMYLHDLGDVIAVRELRLKEQGKPDRKIQVLAGKPRVFNDSGGWCCPFQIVGIGEEKIKYAAGVDAMQTLQLVMTMIGATLQYYSKQSGGQLWWEGDSTGDFGFPRT